MAVISRKWTALFVLALILTACYWVTAKQAAPPTPIERVEAAVEPFKLKMVAETDRQETFTVSADTREIHVHPSWGRVELNEDGGMGINGITSWNVSVLGWDPSLQQALRDALNDSPQSAEQLVEHPDERIQFLLLKILTDWGHGLRSFHTSNDLENRDRWNLQPGAIDALTSFAKRSDPHFVGTVISALQSKGKFSTDVFLAGMAHNSSNIRAETLRWLNPESQKLTAAEMQTIASVLIDHLTDRDLVVRQWSLGGLQSLVAYWEHSLGGAAIDDVRTDQTKMTKLPIAPASDRWYREIAPQASEFAEQYQADWKRWLTRTQESL